MGRIDGEAVYQYPLAERVAWVRLILAILDFAVIWLDTTIPSTPGSGPYLTAFLGAGTLLVYASTALIVVRRRMLPLDRLAFASAILDVCFVTVLILSTDGYLSPFTLWFVFAVIGASFSRYRFLPIFTAFLGLLAHSLVALIPQQLPLDLTVFVVRTGYLFGLAVVLSSISSCLLRQSEAVKMLEATGDAMSRCVTAEGVAGLLGDAVQEAISESTSVEVLLDDGTCYRCSGEEPPDSRQGVESPIVLADRSFGKVIIYRRSSTHRGEDALLRALCTRAASSLRRIELSSELARSAVSAERVRLADQLHDGYLQSLAAIDLRLCAALQSVEPPSPTTAEEINQARHIARNAAAEVRDAFGMRPAADPPGPSALRKLISQRWKGQHRVDIAPDVSLAQGQWLVLEMMVREGLNNARRHAGASFASLSIRQTADGRTVCTLVTDGKKPNLPVRYGYGLMRLRCAAEEQHGTLHFRDGEADGAILRMEFRGKPLVNEGPDC